MDESPQSNKMMSGYMEAALRSWNDEAYKQRLSDNPMEALAEVGWEVPAGTDVKVAFFDQAEVADKEPMSADELAENWEKGIKDGKLRIAISNSSPALETSEISEDKLSQASGGHCAEGWCIGCGP
jgi:hypothetical protein